MISDTLKLVFVGEAYAQQTDLVPEAQNGSVRSTVLLQ